MPETLISTLANLGIAGVMLWWFMTGVLPRLKGVESAIDRMARAILILVIDMASSSSGAKQQAKVIASEVDQAARSRGETPPPPPQ